MPGKLHRAGLLALLAAAIPCADAALVAIARTSAAIEVTSTGAMLRGDVAAGTSRTVVAFEYATNVNDGRILPATPASLQAGSADTIVTATLSGLGCGTTYYFRVRATTNGATLNGEPLSFTTSACVTVPPPPPPPPPPPGPPTTSLECSATNVLCVSSAAGPNQEYATIQAAVDAAAPGDTVLVFDGSYVGFVVTHGGTASAPITVRANGASVVVDRPSSAGEGIRVNNSSYVVIQGFNVTGIAGYGLAARGATPTTPMHGVVFRDNTVSNCGSTDIYASEVSDSLIEGNTASGAGEHGIYLANGGSDNTTIRGNLLYGAAVNGLHLNGDESVGGDGLHSGIVIEDNVIHDNAANGMDLDGITASTIRNNVVYRNGRHAIRAFQIDASAGPRNLTIVNNTLVVSASGGGAGIKLTEDDGGHTIFNNIVANEGSGGSIIVENGNLRSDRNTFVNAAFSLNGGDSMISLAQWRGQPGSNDAASQTSTQDALFLDQAAHDYRLRAGSPAANAGVASFNGHDAPAEDILGVARPQGSAPDQGAYESF